ncbi:MAG: DUF5677 domain-containing protein [Rickettsiales bacterium]|jgi:hypothetical protein|nr:DUF5677 domain-containing protein [Rickettsiales bacterium]
MTNSRKYNWNIEGKIQIIKDFVPMSRPAFNNEDTMLYILWLLYERICSSIKSFGILLENKCYYDAFLTAGQMLETCAILSYIKDNDKEPKLLNFNKCVARSAVGRMIIILDMDKNNLDDLASQQSHISLLKFLNQSGASIVKLDKANHKTYEEMHKEAITKLNTRGGTNAEKIKLLRDSYKRPDPEGYVRAFSKKLDNLENLGENQFAKSFSNYYSKYCCYKHVNMLTPGFDSHDIDNEEISWFMDLVLVIIVYLEKSQPMQYASPYNKNSVLKFNRND